MIKLIIFDLDGILVETKDLHYEALNKALQDLGEQPISYKDHINKYDGMPTKEKLKALQISDSKFLDICKKKQIYTNELLDISIKENPDLINLFKKLITDGYTLHVASNSIRNTVQTVIKNLGLMYYVSYLISNEDVKLGKPSPEMYLKCMLQAEVGPRETLVIEDSYVGRQGAFNSGAYLSEIKNTNEVTYPMIKNSIQKCEKIKPKWKSHDLNIIIPMAGAGSRFKQAGYTFPKPLIDVHGNPMIQVVVENINIEANYIYIVQKEHFDHYNLKPMLEILTPNCKIVTVDKLTEGAACTLLLAKDFINYDNPLLIVNSDQYIEWDSSHFMYTVQNGDFDGFVPTFYNTHPKWSYARLDSNGLIQEIKEKEVISTEATVGIYYWKHGNNFVQYAETMIQKNIRVNNEFYVAPVYNEAIKDGKKIKTYTVDKMYGLGIPEDLEYFLRNKAL